MQCGSLSKSVNNVFSNKAYYPEFGPLKNIDDGTPITKLNGVSKLQHNFLEPRAEDGKIIFRNLEDDEFKYTIHHTGIPVFTKLPQDLKKYRTSIDEIDVILREKLGKERHAIKNLFEKSACQKRGRISKGALLEIFASLFPGLSIDNFQRLLERYNLAQLETIDFHDFEEAFGAASQSRFKPPQLFTGLGAPREVSVAHALQLLKQAARHPGFRLDLILPPSCLQKNGVILRPHMRTALEKLQIRLTDENYERLWTQKFDRDGVCSVPVEELRYMLNLTEDGVPNIEGAVLPRPKRVGYRGATCLTGLPKFERPIFEMLPTTSGGLASASNKHRNRDLSKVEEHWNTEEEAKAQLLQGIGRKVHWLYDPPAFGEAFRLKEGMNSLRELRPRFPSVMDCLYFIFEETYQSMLVAFERLDRDGYNRVSEVECLNLLCEFGMVHGKLGFSDLSVFVRQEILSEEEAYNSGDVGYHEWRRRRGVLGQDDAPPHAVHPEAIRPGLVPYRRLLTKFQRRGSGTPAGKLIDALLRRPPNETSFKPMNSYSVADITEELVKLLHKEYIHFVKTINNAAVNIAGASCLPSDQLRGIIDRVLGYNMQNNQWNDLSKHLKFVSKDYVDIVSFLAKFANTTNICRFKINEDEKWQSPARPKFSRCVGKKERDLGTLLEQLSKTIRRKFYRIDLQYKFQKHEQLNMIDKYTFGKLINNYGMQMSPLELDMVWAVFTQVAGCKRLHHFRTVMRFFFTESRPIIKDMSFKKSHKDVRDPNMDKIPEYRNRLKTVKRNYEDELIRRSKVAFNIKPLECANPAEKQELLGRIADKIRASRPQIAENLFKADKMGRSLIARKHFEEQIS